MGWLLFAIAHLTHYKPFIKLGPKSTLVELKRREKQQTSKKQALMVYIILSCPACQNTLPGTEHTNNLITINPIAWHP